MLITNISKYNVKFMHFFSRFQLASVHVLAAIPQYVCGLHYVFLIVQPN